MTFDEITRVIDTYLKKGETFAVAQVIGRQEPSSGKIGDKAVILSSGELIGWIGGGCVRGIAIKEALEAMNQKTHRLVRVTPERGNNGKEFKTYTMTCHSEGSVDILIEPIAVYPHLIILGRSNIAQNLARIGLACRFSVEVMVHEAPAVFTDMEGLSLKEEISFDKQKSYRRSYIVAATQGEGDEDALERALSTDAEYIGLVSSKKKAAKIKEELLKRKLSKERVDSLRSPVGLDIQAKGHTEVAISILAEIIAHFRSAKVEPSATDDLKKSSPSPSASSLPTDSDAFLEEYYINPVCQVPVSKKNPKHIVDYKGESVYFCCDGCKDTFEKNPEEYMKV